MNTENPHGHTDVTVIVSKCVGARIYGDNLLRENRSSVDEAKALGDPHRGPGMSVLIRPTYNEVDKDGRHYREWRSFNGEDFREIRFAY